MKGEGRGRFITIEGGEGVGKTTNIETLKQRLQHHGIAHGITREPGGTELGEAIRDLLLRTDTTPLNSMAELLLMFAARAQHLATVIEPQLAAGTWVVCDRFTDATYAYQGGGRELGAAAVGQLEQLVQGELRPDLTIILDIDPEQGLARARQRGELDRFEQEQTEFFARVRATYQARAQAEPERCRIVDAGRALAEVQADVAALIDGFIGSAK
ncbi:MAG: dTMP kinase [Porticoccaceae bacterium]